MMRSSAFFVSLSFCARRHKKTVQQSSSLFKKHLSFLSKKKKKDKKKTKNKKNTIHETLKMTTPKKKEKKLKTSTPLSSTLPFPFLPFLFSALDFFFVFTLKVFPQKKKPFNYSFEKKRDSFCVPSLFCCCC